MAPCPPPRLQLRLPQPDLESARETTTAVGGGRARYVSVRLQRRANCVRPLACLRLEHGAPRQRRYDFRTVDRQRCDRWSRERDPHRDGLRPATLRMWPQSSDQRQGRTSLSDASPERESRLHATRCSLQKTEVRLDASPPVLAARTTVVE